MKKEDLILEKPVYNNEVEINIKGNYNEADYVETKNIVSLEEFETFLPIFNKIMNYKGRYNYQNIKEIISKEEIKLLDDKQLIPCRAYEPIHTVTRIHYWFLSKEDNIRYKILN